MTLLTTRPARPGPTTPRRHRPRAAVTETAIVLFGMLAYQAGRLLGGHDEAAADRHAGDVRALESWLHLPDERHLQALLLPVGWLVRFANSYYAGVHLPLTALALLWLWNRRRAAYHWARTSLMLATGAALVVYVLYPVTPPRLVTGGGWVDTALLYGQSVYGASTDTGLTNQFAAVPSLHVGWSVLLAIVLVSSSTTRWRWLWVLHPVTTLLVVVGTGNHYWFDGLFGATLVVTALWLTRRLTGPPSTCAGSRTASADGSAAVERASAGALGPVERT